jgi:ligand-binding sensor domain-containing protein
VDVAINLMDCRRFLFLALIVIASAPGPAAASICDGQPQGFTRLDDPRLPHRSIFALLQDRDGFLWIGTHDGLARYDGAEMRTFRHDPGDPSSLSSSSIRVLLEDAAGRLWVGTENGLNVLDRSRPLGGSGRLVPVRVRRPRRVPLVRDR